MICSSGNAEWHFLHSRCTDYTTMTRLTPGVTVIPPKLDVLCLVLGHKLYRVKFGWASNETGSFTIYCDHLQSTQIGTDTCTFPWQENMPFAKISATQSTTTCCSAQMNGAAFIITP